MLGQGLERIFEVGVLLLDTLIRSKQCAQEVEYGVPPVNVYWCTKHVKLMSALPYRGILRVLFYQTTSHISLALPLAAIYHSYTRIEEPFDIKYFIVTDAMDTPMVMLRKLCKEGWVARHPL